MQRKPDKVIIIGLDAPIAPRLYRLCKEGHLPTLNRLFLEQGVWARHCLVPLPTITPSNWAAIATGAWPSTLEITDFNVHVPGDELNKAHQGLFSDDVHAETIYEAIAKVGKKSILLNYPSTWPPKVEDSIVLGGASIALNTWAQNVQLTTIHQLEDEVITWGQAGSLVTYAGPALYSTQLYPGATVIKFYQPSGWGNLSGQGKAVAAEMPLQFRGNLYQMEPVTWHILVQEGKAIVCERNDVATAITTLAEGQWSPVITKEFRTGKGLRKTVFRMKLVELSSDTERFRLLVTSLAATEGWTHPPSLAAEIKSAEGLPGPGLSWAGHRYGWHGLNTAVEMQYFEDAFFADAAAYLLKNKPWNLFLMHAHSPDHMYHAIADALDNPDPEKRKPYEEAELAIYKSIDDMCAGICAGADDETIIAIISDHGAKPTTGHFGINRILVEGGFLLRNERREVDWSKTKAVGHGSVHIFISVKGRDPHGIVEPGEEYRRVQEEVIKWLYEYNDPESGKKPIVLALKKEDARFIGLYGNWVGDVVYAVGGDFSYQHGPQLPTAQHGIGDLRGVLALTGPNIKKGMVLERTVWIQDLVPTICYLTGWPVPAQVEGAVIYQAMVGPNLK